MDVVILINPRSVLDVGTGFGKYGILCREYLELWDGRYKYSDFQRRIDGIEVFSDYITPLHRFAYDNIINSDIRDYVNANDFRYDLVLLIDVLEHIQKIEGKNLLKNLLTKNAGVLLSTPKQPTDQKDVFNNTHEIHRSKWSMADLKNFGNSLQIPDNVSHIVYIGDNHQIDKLKRIMLSRKLRKFPYVPSMYDMTITKIRRLRLKFSRLCTPSAARS